jgi:AAA family ATP:ADP antiporter
MRFGALAMNVRRFVDIRGGEAARIGSMAALLFFLLAANAIIKTVRDALFLGRFPITQLPYVYLLAAFLAAVVIGVYARYASRLSLSQVILGSHLFIISNVIIFWLLVAFYDFAWVLWAFYMWSAIVGLVAVAQFWTLANEMFNPREAKRLFGILTAAGTLGAMTGGFGANLAVRFVFGTKELLWVVVVVFAGAFSVAWFAVKEGERALTAPPRAIEARDSGGAFKTLRGSQYLQGIAALIFVSIIVSTLIDYQFKAAAKEAYRSPDALAGFFGSYYAWLSVVTMFAQLWLTGTLLTRLGLASSLLVLPLTLLAGSIGLLVWPGLFTATATRLTEASLRTSVNDSGVEILYLPIPDFIKKKLKVFLDVTVQRLGDGMAALIILSHTFFLGTSEVSLLSYFSIGLILLWVAVVFVVQGGYIEALRGALAYHELFLEGARIDYGEKGTVEAILRTLEEKDERSVLFGLDLIEKLDPKDIVGRLPRGLLHHSSPEVQRRTLALFSQYPDASIVSDVRELLAAQDKQVQAEAVNAVFAILDKDAIRIIRPFLESPDPEVQRSAIHCMLQTGDPEIRRDALNSFQKMLTNRKPDGEKCRVEAARLMGELDDTEFPGHLSRLIEEDPSSAVIRTALASAGKRAYPGVIREVIARLGSSATKPDARAALIDYGEIGVRALRAALFDSRVPRDVRLNIPRTLSKIHSQAAMNALLGGLLEEDRTIRFKVILGLEEMARRYGGLRIDREIIESAIISDALLYSQRFAFFSALFADGELAPVENSSLLRHALTDSMQRVKERVMWLLSLIYPAKDMRRFWAGWHSRAPNKRAHAVEFLDNLLTGEIKRYVFPLFSDAPQAKRFRASLDLLGIHAIDTEAALRELLEQGDIWLRAATVWEIGIRGLTGFRDKIAELLKSENVVLREAAEVVINRT